ncbi:hypothetical protein NUACC26_049080 [Scytonema sp. NUACC26]
MGTGDWGMGRDIFIPSWLDFPVNDWFNIFEFSLHIKQLYLIFSRENQKLSFW